MRKILVPLDGSAFAERAIETARSIAGRADADIEFVVVHEPALPASRLSGAPSLDSRLDADIRASLRQYLERLEAGEKGRGTRVAGAVFREGRAVEEIAAQVAEGGAELVVMTTHGRGGFERMWLGSVADGLIRSATAPVLVVREGRAAGMVPLDRVVVALAGSDQDDVVVEAALRVTDPIRARYVLAHVVPPSPMIGAVDTGLAPPPNEMSGVPAAPESDRLGAAERYLQWMARPFRAHMATVETRVAHAGSPARALLMAAEDAGANLIVVGTAARAPVPRLFMGSVADKVVRRARCSVLVVPAKPRVT